MIRLLRADEIECRVSMVKENGLSLLLYKDARVDQRILDETFGPFGWQRSHQCIDGNLYCTVSIYDRETGSWISKQDVGTTGYTEKEKSQASDSFKRACFNWGIGRELYSAPFIWIPAGSANIKKDNKKECLYCNDHFSVQSIGYGQDREIHALTIINDSCSKQIVYQMKTCTVPSATSGAAGTPARSVPDKRSAVLNGGGKEKPDTKGGLSGSQMRSLEKELERTGVGMDAVKERYQIEQPGQMTEGLYQRVMAALAKTKTAA